MPDIFTRVPQVSLAAALRLWADQRLDQLQEGFVSARTTQPDRKQATYG